MKIFWNFIIKNHSLQFVQKFWKTKQIWSFKNKKFNNKDEEKPIDSLTINAGIYVISKKSLFNILNKKKNKYWWDYKGIAKKEIK